jgi:hypothetical protein
VEWGMTEGHPFTVYRDIGEVWYKLNPSAFKAKPFARDVCQFLIHTAVTECDAKSLAIRQEHLRLIDDHLEKARNGV